jgi:predicted HTH transcriptional regulator
MKIDPEEIRKLGETQTVEFKKSLSLQKEGFKALCGMINSDSATGAVVFGVSPDCSIAGIEPGNLDSAQKTLAQNVQPGFDPTIIPRIIVLECEDKHLIRLEADRASGVSYHEYDGRAYIREGSTTRQLSYDEKRQLAKKRDRDQHSGPWKCERCGGVVGTLSGMIITDEGVHKSYACHCGGEFWPIT